MPMEPVAAIGVHFVSLSGYIATTNALLATVSGQMEEVKVYTSGTWKEVTD